MGNKGSASGKPSKVPHKPLKLTSKDIAFISKSSGLSKDEIQQHFNNFIANNPDGKLDRDEFKKLYLALRNEDVSNLDEIADYIFRSFDSDNNGFLTFNEFMISYGLTTKGDLDTRLEYAFDLYDADNNGYLSSEEVRQGVRAMFDLLGAEKTCSNINDIVNDCCARMDANGDRQLTKQEFLKGCSQDFSLRQVLNPFD